MLKENLKGTCHIEQNGTGGENVTGLGVEVESREWQLPQNSVFRDSAFKIFCKTCLQDGCDAAVQC